VVIAELKCAERLFTISIIKQVGACKKIIIREAYRMMKEKGRFPKGKEKWRT